MAEQKEPVVARPSPAVGDRGSQVVDTPGLPDDYVPPSASSEPVAKPQAVRVVVHDDEVVRRRRPGFKLVNGGWVRDLTTGEGAR